MPQAIPFSEYQSKKFGFLTILEVVGCVPYGRGQQKIVSAKCDCGVVKNFRLFGIVSGNTKSCGCYNKKRISEAKAVHKMTRHSLYNSWMAMKMRCNNVNAKNYKWYGGAGVKICEEWNSSFIIFRDWAMANGWEKGMQVDKDIKGNGLLYSPDNCLLVTSLRNNRAKSSIIKIKIDGETKTLGEWCDIHGVSYRLAYERIFDRKWDAKKAITTTTKFKGGGAFHKSYRTKNKAK